MYVDASNYTPSYTHVSSYVVEESNTLQIDWYYTFDRPMGRLIPLLTLIIATMHLPIPIPNQHWP